ncbi:hypothetical protein PG989_012730 [Apiospora arundinis]|uniref:Major facilitator superfamily transporter n=1 Tax=Apiospora arundinis TaxID=335852 RepID=A0ABR2IGZ2_9PEZI
MGYHQDQTWTEKDGINVGGWSMRHVLWPKKTNGLHDSSEDRASQATVEVDWSTEEERALRRKLDLRVLLPCFLVYFFAYLDRGNIGNVKILRSGTDYNISKQLHLAGRDFNWAVAITYFPVVFFLIPSNVIVKKVSAKTYLPIIMALFGGVVMCMAACQSASNLFAVRFFLGVPESGVMPASILYFSFWYKPVERAWRIGVFYSATALAGGCSGFLAVGIDKLNGVKGLSSWQWVFILEGAITILMAIPIYFLLLTFPESSDALTERQRHIAINRLAMGASRQTDKTWDWGSVRAVLGRPSTYIFWISYHSLSLVGTSQAIFTPTILHEFVGFSVGKANTFMAIIFFYVIPLYCFWPLHSDWTRERMWHFVLPILFALPCYIAWTWASAHQSFGGISSVSIYGLAFLGHLSSITQPVMLSYRSSTLYGAAEQAVGGGIQISAVYLASIISPQMYPDSDAPWYLPAFISTVCLLVLCVLLYLSLPAVLLWEAKSRKAKHGHAMPPRAREDAKLSQVAALRLQRAQDDSPKLGVTEVEKV